MFLRKFSYDVQPWAKAKKGHTQFADGDVAFAKISPSFENRKSMVLTGLPNGIGAGATELIVLRQHEINPYYTLWLISQDEFIRRGVITYSGVVGQQRISMDYVRNYPIPVPPATEQQRIVDRIERLFSKLGEAEEKLQSVLDSFETRKAAILHKAFIGELTAKWRADKGIDIAKWGKTRIKDVCETRAGYAFDSEKFTTHGYQVIRMGNLYDGILDLSKKPVYYSESDLDERILQKSAVRPGDILITLTGTKYKRDYGYAVCILNPDKLLVNQRILCLTPLEVVNRKFLHYFLQSDIFRDIFFSNETGGVNQGNVSSKFVENIELPFPNKEEQIEIARILDNVLNKEQVIKEDIEQILSQIKTIKKSILSKAFHGQLGTNNPNDEDAKELVKRILG